MARSVWFRMSVLLLVLISLASPAVAADKTPSRPQSHGLVAWVWQALGHLQKALLPEGTVQGDSGGTMDPDGLTTAPPDGGDSRAGMNPDG
jgi:hypothetical protein